MASVSAPAHSPFISASASDPIACITMAEQTADNPLTGPSERSIPRDDDECLTQRQNGHDRGLPLGIHNSALGQEIFAGETRLDRSQK